MPEERKRDIDACFLKKRHLFGGSYHPKKYSRSTHLRTVNFALIVKKCADRQTVRPFLLDCNFSQTRIFLYFYHHHHSFALRGMYIHTEVVRIKKKQQLTRLQPR